MQHLERQHAAKGPIGQPQELARESAEVLDTLHRELNEIAVLIKQTSAEIERLAPRSVEATRKLHDLESNVDNYTRAEIKEAFSTAHEADMRLFLMRGQLEMLEHKRRSLVRFCDHLERCTSLLDNATQGIAASSDIAPLRHSAPSAVAGAGCDFAVVFKAQEEERRRIVHQMHDGPVQLLTNLILRAEICERLLTRDPASARGELASLRRQVINTLQDTRRFIFDLHPMILDDLGLVPALRRQAESFTSLTKIPVKLSTQGAERRFGSQVEVALFRIAQEALSNASRHGNPSEVQITVEASEDSICLTVGDDGRGFDVEKALSSAGHDPARGLRGMQERVRALGGQIRFESSPDRGAKVMVQITTS